MSFSFSLEEWLSLPKAEIAEFIAGKHLGVLMSIDGTRRHYLLSRPITDGKIYDFEDYARHSAEAYVRVYDLLFSFGIETVMTPIFYPPNFQRSQDFLRRSMDANRELLYHEPFAGLYQRWELRARLYGDYDFAANAVPVHTDLEEVAATLKQLTPHGSRRLLFGYCAGSFSEEIVHRTALLTSQLGRAPTLPEVRLACFPDGPTELNILIKTGWLRVGMLLPPILDGGKTDLYVLLHLPLDLQEEVLRRILYDHLFLRRAAPEDDLTYNADALFALDKYYQEHKDAVMGLGQLIGPGLWYADPAR
jgi:hypothetical protein